MKCSPGSVVAYKSIVIPGTYSKVKLLFAKKKLLDYGIGSRLDNIEDIKAVQLLLYGYALAVVSILLLIHWRLQPIFVLALGALAGAASILR